MGARVSHLFLVTCIVTASCAWSGLAADFPADGVPARAQTRAVATDESVRAEPAGRGRLPLPDEITLPALDAEQIREQIQARSLGPTRPLPSQIDGTWDWTQEGKRVWRVTIRSTGARALRLRFEKFSVSGAVWLYSDESNGPQIGPYSDEGPHGDGGFWSEFVFSESVTVEYVPDDMAIASEGLPFRLLSVAHIADERFPAPTGVSKGSRPQPRSLAGCHLDVSCYPDMQKRTQPSVARIYITNGVETGTCTGFLIGTRYRSDKRLLFLTSGHCIRTREEARDASFLWNYQTEECHGSPDSNQWADPLVQTYAATLVVSKDDRDDDFALLVLSKDDVEAVTGWLAEGWALGEVRTGEPVSTVGHPDGSFKRVAFGRTVDIRWRGLSSRGFQTVQWRSGATEPGSSGSPVFKGIGEDRRVVGIHSSGTSPDDLDASSPGGPYCDADSRSAFSRFDHIYKTIGPFLERESELPGNATIIRRIRIALGSTGETVNLLFAEEGGYSINGVPVVSGETSVRAANGNQYVLTRGDDGIWTARYQVEIDEVRLGRSGETVTIRRTEDGSYVLGETVVESGVTTVTATNGNTYRLTVTEYGRWWGWSWHGRATYVTPVVEVVLGQSGEVVTIEKRESGYYRLRGGRFGYVSDGRGTVTASNGNEYLLTLNGDGTWTATYQVETDDVWLSGAGETVTITRAEDGNYMLGETVVEVGVTTVTASNGNVYTLTISEYGWWDAEYRMPVFEVVLGRSGEVVTIEKSEYGSYRVKGGKRGYVSDGRGTVTASNGNEYLLTRNGDGTWTASYQAETDEVRLGLYGGKVTITRAEDGRYWMGETLVEVGVTTVMASNGNEYLLTMNEYGWWDAEYRTPVVEVVLGLSGEVVTIEKRESGYYRLSGGRYGSVRDGQGTVTASNGSEYVLTRNGDGTWTASYQVEVDEVRFGWPSTMVKIRRAEDGRYWMGETLVKSGVTTVTASGGDRYMLTVTDYGYFRSWRAVRVEP